MGKPPTVKTAANLFRQLCYQNKDALLAGIIVAGYDDANGGSVYSVPLGGSLIRQPFAIGGAAAPPDPLPFCPLVPCSRVSRCGGGSATRVWVYLHLRLLRLPVPRGHDQGRVPAVRPELYGARHWGQKGGGCAQRGGARVLTRSTPRSRWTRARRSLDPGHVPRRLLRRHRADGDRGQGWRGAQVLPRRPAAVPLSGRARAVGGGRTLDAPRPSRASSLSPQLDPPPPPPPSSRYAAMTVPLPLTKRTNHSPSSSSHSPSSSPRAL